MRLKSDKDLQKLWIVLMKERNMLHSARHMHKKRQTEMPFPDRIQKVRRSMALIKKVIAERIYARDKRRRLIWHYKHNTPTFNVDAKLPEAAEGELDSQ